MVYITVKQSPVYKQMTFEEFLFGDIKEGSLIVNNTTNTRTYEQQFLSSRFSNKLFKMCGTTPYDMIKKLHEFNESTADLRAVPRKELYREFYIPKRSGGLRKIDAPNDDLKNALRRLKKIFEEDFHCLYYTSAFAYVKGRSTVDAVKRHQANESKWFAKFDLSNFFGSTTLDFVMRMFSMIFPFSEIINYGGKRELETALELAFLDGGLPQGTPISPTITNIMMIPIDYTINKQLRSDNIGMPYIKTAKEEWVKGTVYNKGDGVGHKGKSWVSEIIGNTYEPGVPDEFFGMQYWKEKNQSFVYTRYADDFLISSKYDFKVGEMQGYICRVLAEFEAPFTIKPSKTRYGSSAGSNWNLGVMLNKDNKLTVGHKKKRQLQSMLHSFIMDTQNGKQWELNDIQVMAGYHSYYRMVEADAIDGIIRHINEKHSVDVLKMIKDQLNANHGVIQSEHYETPEVWDDGEELPWH